MRSAASSAGPASLLEAACVKEGLLFADLFLRTVFVAKDGREYTLYHAMVELDLVAAHEHGDAVIVASDAIT